MILKQMPHSDNHLMRHLLIGILLSYKSWRKKLHYHGNINQNSIIGIDNPEAKLYPNNTRGDYYDEFGRLKNLRNDKKSGQEHLDMDLYDFKYRLIYHHMNMLTIKEWLGRRTAALNKGARVLMEPNLLIKYLRYHSKFQQGKIAANVQKNDTGVNYEDLQSNDMWSIAFLLLLTHNHSFGKSYTYREENQDNTLIKFHPNIFKKYFDRFCKKYEYDRNLIYVLKRMVGYQKFEKSNNF